MRDVPSAARRGSVMLHICCAPDATVPVEELKGEGWELFGFFYGSNIHPEDEYRRRLEALRTLQEREPFPLTEAPYDPDEWFSAVRGFWDEPECGERCAVCFNLQLEAAADHAVAQGCSHLCTTLTISPHKDVDRIASLGQEICVAHGLVWEERVWRKKGGFLRSLVLSKEFGLYRQNYCGCTCSMRSKEALVKTNMHSRA